MNNRILGISTDNLRLLRAQSAGRLLDSVPGSWLAKSSMLVINSQHHDLPVNGEKSLKHEQVGQEYNRLAPSRSMNPPPSNDGPAHGESHGVDTLISLVYKELRRLASAKFRGERPEHTLQPTAVVHEAYLRLKRTGKPRWESETDFRRYATPVIRRVLIDYARSRPPNTRVTVTSWDGVGEGLRQTPDVDVLALHEALERLEKRDPGLARIVELRYFGGLTEEETAKAANIPLGTLKNQLTFARTWLRRELTKAPKR